MASLDLSLILHGGVFNPADGDCTQSSLEVCPEVICKQGSYSPHISSTRISVGIVFFSLCSLCKFYVQTSAASSHQQSERMVLLPWKANTNAGYLWQCTLTLCANYLRTLSSDLDSLLVCCL